jgi:hypothetical protein
MLQLCSLHERSDVWREQKTLRCFNKRAKIIVSHFSPGDEEVTQTMELRITSHSAVRHFMLAENRRARDAANVRGTPVYERNSDRFIASRQR